MSSLFTRKQLNALRKNLAESRELNSCREELIRMFNIKEAQFLRADELRARLGWELAASLDAEMQIIADALWALQHDDPPKAATILERLKSYNE